MNYDVKIPIVFGVVKFASGVVKTAVDIVVEETVDCSVGSSVDSSVVSVLSSGVLQCCIIGNQLLIYLPVKLTTIEE